MAFNRIINIKVGPKPTEGKTYSEGILLSDLNVSFEITRSINISDNNCTITVYNPKEDTISNMLSKGNNVRVEAGYEDEGTGVIFSGNILESESQYDGVNKIVNITAGGLQKSDKPLDYATISLSYAADSKISLPIQDIASELGLTPFGLDALSGITLPNGFVYTGSVKGALYQTKRVLKNQSIGIFIDNDVLVLYKIGVQDATRFTFAYLTKSTGLINAFYKEEEFRKKDKVEYKRRVEYKSILNPNLVPNGLVTIKGKLVDGTFINEKVTFKGDNMNGEFTTQGLAIV